MSDLICRKTLMRCPTPGTCSPHGGCTPQPVAESVFKVDYAALIEQAKSAPAEPDAELVACLKFARTTMAVVADNANLRGVEYRSLIAEIKRIDAKLASLKGAP